MCHVRTVCIVYNIIHLSVTSKTESIFVSMQPSGQAVSVSGCVVHGTIFAYDVYKGFEWMNYGSSKT